MSPNQSKRTIGTALIVFFGSFILTFFLTSIYNLSFFKLGLYDKLIHGYSLASIIHSMTFFIRDILCLFAFLLMAMTIKKSPIATIGAIILSIITLYFTINIPLSYLRIDVFEFLGTSKWLLIGTLEFIAAGMLFFGMKTWIPLQISAFTYWLYGLGSDIIWMVLDKIRIRAIYSDDFSKYNMLLKIENAWTFVGLFISIVTFIFTIIWMVKKSKNTSSPIYATY